ncbi:MAG: GTPase [Pararhodobacter sp.]
MLKDHIRWILGRGERLDLPRDRALPVPTLWLLGRTGAGKSSIVRALTGAAEVGSGFAPCTRTARAYDFPPDHPVLRFLDTRGLDEAGYDPSEDLHAAEQGSHAVLAVLRLDDPAQGSVVEALREIRRQRPRMPVLAVHTGADLIADAAARARSRAQIQARLDAAAGGALPSIELALPEDGPAELALAELREAIAGMLPELALLMLKERDEDEEALRFAALRPLVLWYAGAAGASDAAPLLGTISVPALQGAMLHALARRYGLEWTRKRIALFASALGSGALLHFAAWHALRQVAKLVPVVGQTLGAAAAATASFAATYALGRAASAWLYRNARDEPLEPAELRRLYDQAMRRARDVAR